MASNRLWDIIYVLIKKIYIKYCILMTLYAILQTIRVNFHRRFERYLMNNHLLNFSKTMNEPKASITYSVHLVWTLRTIRTGMNIFCTPESAVYPATTRIVNLIIFSYKITEWCNFDIGESLSHVTVTIFNN